MTSILGISAFYHDSAAGLVIDGNIVAAAQEERFTRIRHDYRFPRHAVAYCLKEAGIAIEKLDYVVFYDKPLLKFDRILATQLTHAPTGFDRFRTALSIWLGDKIHTPAAIRRGLQDRYRGPLLFTNHHESHAASAFFPSPYERAAILTCDGVGEWATTTWGVGEGAHVRLLNSISFPHSLGLLYSAFTDFCGFKVNSGEYKLMGLAPYGEPIYADLIRDQLIDVRPDGSYRLHMEYFTYPYSSRMTAAKFAALFGGPARKPETEITKREMDIAASIQRVTEDVMLAMVRQVHRETGMRHLCLAGGVALNCVANGRILREGPFDGVWIQPAAGDAGGALGAALFVWHQLLKKPRDARPGDSQKGSLLGPAYSPDEVADFLGTIGVKHRTFDDEEALLATVVELLASERVIGWFHGRMEFGPRALGARSIIGDARSPRMQATMNLKIKYRESFRPFAPCVLRERAHEIFEIPEGVESPYMLLVADIRKELRRAPVGETEGATRLDPDLCKRVQLERSVYPAITHVDHSARVQTVDEERHGRFYRLMKEFERRTGSPVIINTSFNVRGEPIVNTPAQAYECFLFTDMDALVLEDAVLLKTDIPEASRGDRARYLERFSLD